MNHLASPKTGIAYTMRFVYVFYLLQYCDYAPITSCLRITACTLEGGVSHENQG